ncbi:MAG: acyltransferase [Clostridiales bacterium]|nr:acyltransferase [Clostridiales bacterium]
MEKKDLISTKHIDVLDGIRAISVIIVLIFHFWQQTWIFPIIKTPFLGFMGVERIDFTPLAKVGYLFVDMMILISGFLLFLPVARNVFSGDPIEKWSTFFKKRAIRILPSYLLCIVLLFFYELIAGGYGRPINWGVAFSDLILHLTFMQTWTTQSYLATKLNVVLWTLAIEVWFYVLFPVIAGIIRRRKKEKDALGCIFRASVTFAVMIGISIAYIYGYVLNTGSAFSSSVDKFLLGIKIGSMQVGIRSDYLSMVINQLPAFMGLYAVGIAGSMIYVFAAGKLKRKWWIGTIFTVIAIVFLWLIIVMIKDCASKNAEEAQIWQMTERLKLALVYMGFILSSAFAVKPFRFLLSNKLMVFLSTISYNLYIWHQWLCVKLKYEWRVPYWTGDTPPNQLYGPESDVWKAKYAVIITIGAFALAALMTYLFERPMSDLLNKRPSIYNGKLKTLFKKKQ